jgi:hypothetical protein
MQDGSAAALISVRRQVELKWRQKVALLVGGYDF